MIDKTDLQKVELANDLLVVLKSASTQDQIDILQLALDLMVAKKRLNEPPEKHVRTWVLLSKTQQAVSYLVTLEDAIFTCTCPDFQFRGGECKHIKKVKMKVAGENQKNKLPGVNHE
jgi:predicted nucleic acid-binding Zn finger protein